MTWRELGQRIARETTEFRVDDRFIRMSPAWTDRIPSPHYLSPKSLGIEPSIAEFHLRFEKVRDSSKIRHIGSCAPLGIRPVFAD